MVLPSFIIIGAGRSGTTSLYHYLGQHPDVYMSPIKEPRFFALPNKPPNKTKSLADLARAYPIRNLTGYAELFAGADGVKAVGEATPRYLYAPGTATRIFSVLPGARLIAVLRNPVDRAFASYLGNLRDGRETRSFEDVVKEELSRPLSDFDPGNWDYSSGYFYEGLYHRHLSSFLDEFPRQQMHIILFDDLRSDLNRVLVDICRFLEIDPDFDFDTFVRYNANGVPRSAMIERLTGKNWITLALKARLPKRIRDPAYRFAMKLRDGNLNRPAIPAVLRDQLVDFYREDIHMLQKLLNRNLMHWLTQSAD
jgi:hypothetical protein